jgi:hypothetical protein
MARRSGVTIIEDSVIGAWEEKSKFTAETQRRREEQREIYLSLGCGIVFGVGGRRTAELRTGRTEAESAETLVYR